MQTTMADENSGDNANAKKTLLEQATLGEPKAIEQLLDGYLPRVRAFIRLRMGPALRAREATTDLAQSVCVDLPRRQDDFE